MPLKTNYLTPKDSKWVFFNFWYRNDIRFCFKHNLIQSLYKLTTNIGKYKNEIKNN